MIIENNFVVLFMIKYVIFERFFVYEIWIVLVFIFLLFLLDYEIEREN